MSPDHPDAPRPLPNTRYFICHQISSQQQFVGTTDFDNREFAHRIAKNRAPFVLRVTMKDGSIPAEVSLDERPLF